MSSADTNNLSLRAAGPADAAAVAALHADSWRRHYRGAYADEFLDGEVFGDRIEVWAARLRNPDPRQHTLLAETDHLVGFANTYLGEDPRWGALLDNLHVAAGQQRRGIGSRLLALTAEAVRACEGPGARLHLWVLEQNHDAQAFYRAHGGLHVGTAAVTAPGGVSDRLCGSPLKLRYVWPRLPALRVGADSARV